MNDDVQSSDNAQFAQNRHSPDGVVSARMFHPEKDGTLSVCSQRAAQILQRLIAEKQERILIEWFDLAARAGQRPPDDVAPLLSGIAKERAALREWILPILGEHGFGLGERSEQSDRIAMLDAALNGNDEAFLVECLDDSDRTIRRIAANCLARLPDSDFSQRLRNYARSCIAVTGGDSKKRLCVSVPDTFNEEMRRIGVEKESPRIEEMLDRRSAWLLQILFRVPPSFWHETLGVPPGDLLQLASETEYETVLRWGWSTATLLHRDAAWAEVFIANAGKRWLRLTTQTPGAFLGILSRERREAVILSKLTAARRNPTRLASVFQLIGNKECWTPAVSEAILSRLVLLSPLLERTRHVNYNLLSLFRQAALNADSGMLVQLREQLLPATRSDLPIGDTVRAIMEIVDIRRELHRELAS